MKRHLSKFLDKDFDIIIIGGGITGACLAHDASLSGLRVALLEKMDFGMSTSAASSKLLHGGIRYLQKFQFGKVRESARERCIFQVIAPHLTHYIPFMVPTVKGSFMKGIFAMKAGMFLYEIVCSGLNAMISDPGKKVPRGKFYSREGVVSLVPLLAGIKGLNGGHTLFESHMYNSERMTLAFIKTAVSNGATAANYAKAVRFVKDGGRVSGVVVRDHFSGDELEVHGKMVINAAGPFIPQVNRAMENIHLKKETTGYSKGVHIVTRQICDEFALAISSTKKTEGIATRGGRHFFMIPWRGKSLIGTTNVPYEGNLDDLSVTKKDITDFLADINDLLPEMRLTEQDVCHAFTGLYPLITEEIKTDTYQGTGTYQVVDHAENGGVEGMVSVLGAKYTTGRIVAEKAMDLVVKKLGIDGMKCQTATAPLLEGRIDMALADFVQAKKKQYCSILSEKSIEYLVTVHGSEIDTVVACLQEGSGLMDVLSAERETLIGEIHYAVDKEMACTLVDMIFARTGLGTIGHPGNDVVRAVAHIMAEKLGWGEDRIRTEIQSVEMQYQYLQ